MKHALLTSLFVLLAGFAYAQETPDGQSPEEPSPAEPSDTPIELSEEEMSHNMELMGSRFLNDRIKAQRTIARAGKSAIPKLRTALESENTFQRMNAVELLGRMKQPEVIPVIAAMFADSSTAVRISASQALLKYGSDAVAEISRLEKSGEFDSSVLPSAVLVRLSRTLIIALFKEIDSGGHFLGQYESIVKLGSAAVPALLLLFDESLEAYARGSQGAVKGGIDSVVNALGDFEPDKRIIEKLENLVPSIKGTARGEYLQQLTAVALAKLGNDKLLNEMIEARIETAKNNTNATSFANVAILYHRVGNYEESQKWFRRAAESADPTSTGHYYNLACALAMGGKLDQAVEALKTSFENNSVRSEWMAVDRELDPIREAIQVGREAGLVMGIGGHRPATHDAAVEQELGPQFYCCSFYNLGGDRGESYLPEDREAMTDLARKLAVPVIGYKIMAAGRNDAEEAFSYAFSHLKRTDAVCVGVFPKHRPSEVRQCADLTRRFGAPGA